MCKKFQFIESVAGKKAKSEKNIENVKRMSKKTDQKCQKRIEKKNKFYGEITIEKRATLW